ncbi:MAG: spiro-SPASM protein [Spirochaetota bacterium]
MRTAVLIYAGSMTEQALVPLGGGPSALERVLSYARAIPDVVACRLLQGSLELPDTGCHVLQRQSWTDAAVLEEAQAFCASLGEAPEALVLVKGDEPFLDLGLTLKMLASHRRYRAEYSFADGYPTGLSPEIVHPRIVPALQALAAKSPRPPARDWLFTVIQGDINSFDIETEISPKDLRDRRIVLACDTKRNLLLVERFLAAGLRDVDSALDMIPLRPELARTLPAFVGVQIVGGCLQACAFCPWPTLGAAAGASILKRRDFMPLARFDALMGGLAAISGDAVVDLSLWGEPSLHPEFPKLVDAVLSRPGLSLIVETSGLGWGPGILEAIAASHPDRIDWIVSLDAATPEMYQKLRGEGWTEAQACVDRLLALWPQQTHPQMLRTVDNEEELEAFWRGWKKRSDKVIVQKYSRFAGLLPERKVADLSPLVRKPCWHLARDLSILMDGGVPPCRELTRDTGSLGNLFAGLSPEDSGTPAFFESELARIWESGAAMHGSHCSGELPEDCKDCDEYYTYNA